MTTAVTKYCRRCKADKPLSDFHVGDASRLEHGRQSYCKPCMAAYQTESRRSLVETRDRLKSARPTLEHTSLRVQNAVAVFDREAVALGESMNRVRLAALKLAEEVEHAKAIVREALK